MEEGRYIVFPFRTDNGDQGELRLYSELTTSPSVWVLEQAEAEEFGEAKIQLLEGCSYEFSLTIPLSFRPIPGLVNLFRSNTSAGRITPQNYVGSITLELVDSRSGDKIGVVPIEVRSVKTEYRTDYRYMLEYIADKCTDLLMHYTSPVNQTFKTDPHTDAKSIYQRFAFVKSILESDEFREAVYRIQEYPVTNWGQEQKNVSFQQLRKIDHGIQKQIARHSNRISLEEHHPLRSQVQSLPAKVITIAKYETTDTPENRFVKYVLGELLNFCTDARNKFDPDSRAHAESLQMENMLENIIGHAVFREVTKPTLFTLNSPILQRKEGYREILRIWLMFGLAANISWDGGEDVYEAGKRDVATLYEYWAFFVLLDLFSEIFQFDQPSVEQLIQTSADGLTLILKKGRQFSLSGKYQSEGRKLMVSFKYNNTFLAVPQYPSGGSWTTGMRPDYTLSIWPDGLTPEVAEQAEMIVHLHFDAKYKLGEWQAEETTFQRDDLLKMHAYRDAIRRTAGSYILYPGHVNYYKSPYHEILPGVGAFSVRPTRNGEDISALKTFILRTIDHILNRASQRERMAYHTFNIHKSNDQDILRATIPEFDGITMPLPPSETFVLIGFVKDADHYTWIRRQGLYNVRIDAGAGSMRVTGNLAEARYLLLHQENELETSDIYEMPVTGPRLFSREQMLRLEYPNPRRDFYLVFSVGQQIRNRFSNASWDLRKINSFRSGHLSAAPMVISLTELMEAKTTR